MDDRTKKLLAVGASVGANCHPCLEYHVGRALELGIDRSEIMEAVEVAKAVRGGATASMDKFALKLLGSDLTKQSCNSQAASCCCS
ncbi:MAG: carboxymuconolactone decarboxylase family protein [Deltaproteobacteria bacterium]|nr:carboxymuconolactone decarboxylase family protein [Deltaproteobacteria bacterium]